MPVRVVSGFLGSGKTSLVREMIREDPATAVIVNEVGDVCLDHNMVRASQERLKVVHGGCACCTKREDLVRALGELLDDRDRGVTVGRVVIETSGLADPAPVVGTVIRDSVLRHHFSLEPLVVTVDAVNCISQLSRHPEAVRQVILADEIVVTKLDLVDECRKNAVNAAVRALNPAATIVPAVHGVVDEEERDEGRRDPRNGQGEPVRGPSLGRGHTDDVVCVTLTPRGCVDWLGFTVWLTMLLHARGQDVLRVKSLLRVKDHAVVAVNGVQHVVHMPEHAPSPQDAHAESKIILITRGMASQRIRESFDVFQRLAVAPGKVESS